MAEFVGKPSPHACTLVVLLLREPKRATGIAILLLDRLRFLVGWWVELIVRLKFLAALVSLTLDSVDVTLRAGLYVGSVSFIGVDVHGQFEARIHSHQHVAEN